jgi:hypothetical protein
MKKRARVTLQLTQEMAVKDLSDHLRYWDMLKTF